MKQPPSPSGRASLEFRPRSVVKRFADPEDFYRELRVYQAALPMLPVLLGFADRQWIELERIAGQPYLDGDFSPAAAKRLGATLARFHLAWASEDVCLCHWDNQPQNILRSGADYRFIDFSQSRLAPPEADVSHLFLFWAAEFAPEANQALWNAFLEAYLQLAPLHPGRWEQALKQSLERFSARRKHHARPIHHLDQREFERNLDCLRALLA